MITTKNGGVLENRGPEQRRYLTAKQVRTRYGGVSDMSLWRWLKDETLRFPQPMTINGRRFWAIDELDAWESARAGGRP